jgi:hypothetical protein
MSTVRIQVRRGLASEWTTANPVLAAGEMGVETNTNKFKFGNGTDTWSALSYAAADSATIGELSQDAINQALSVGQGLTKTYDDNANTIVVTVNTDVISTKEFATSEATTKAAAAQTAAEDYTDNAVNAVNNSLSGYLETGDRGTANGVASLDGSGKVPESQLKLTGLTSSISTSGSVSADNVTVSGNLVVNGTTTTLNTQNFTITDPLFYIGEDNHSNQIDLGFVASHDDGTYNHTGLVKDASDGKWKLFKGVTDEPTTTINFAQGSLDDLEVGILGANEVNVDSLTVNTDIVLPAGSINEASIANNAVSENKIASNSISFEKIKLDAVTTPKIADSAVTSAKIEDNAVTSVKILDGSVTEGKIAGDAVTTTKIADAAVTSAKLANASVSSAKIIDESISESKIATSAVTNIKIADGSISTAKVADLAITDAKVSATAAIAQSKIDGLTDALDLLAPIAAPTFTGTVVLPGTTSIGDVSSTEIGYLNGVTSSVQTQITAASTALSNHEADTTNIHGIADTSLLATTANVATAKSEAIDAAAVASENYTDGVVAALTKSSVGLANVDNTSDANKPVSTAQATAIATAKSEAIADATAQVNAVIASAPAALNTLDELAAALGDDANFATTITNGLAAKAPIAGPTFTGTVTVAANGIAFTDKTQTKAGVPSLTTIATAVSASTTLDALGTDEAVRDSLVPLSGAVNISFEATGNAKYAIGSSINFYQSSGTGANITGSGVTILATPGATLRTTNSSVTATKVAATTWLLAGDLKA